jgi:hypothetical protein
MRINQIFNTSKQLATELAKFSVFGCLCGAGIGFFVFLHLGFPGSERTSGYISGLFVLSGFKLGVAVWGAYRIIIILRRLLVESVSCTSSYQFSEMDLKPDGTISRQQTRNTPRT